MAFYLTTNWDLTAHRSIVRGHPHPLLEAAHSMRQSGTRTFCPGAASQLGSQHGELTAWRGWVEAVLD
jgi:hypothetical protein